MANKKIKKYWIRYNPKSDRLEEEVTEARFRPEGSGWKEVLIDKCCNVPLVETCTEAERTFASDAIAGTGFDSYDVELSTTEGTLFTDSYPTLEDALDALNAAYLGLITFTIEASGDDFIIQGIAESCTIFTLDITGVVIP